MTLESGDGLDGKFGIYGEVGQMECEYGSTEGGGCQLVPNRATSCSRRWCWDQISCPQTLEWRESPGVRFSEFAAKDEKPHGERCQTCFHMQ